jgi:uncharacterized protein (UPF0548 family)
MFLLHRPSSEAVEAFLAACRGLPLSYHPIGLANQTSRGFVVDEQLTIVGSGHEAFARARAALQEWKHFDLGWIELFPKGAPIAEGTVVAVLVRHFGCWSLNGCRVLYAIAGDDATVFGFGYGTLTDHAESGEEIFSVSFQPDTGAVSYLIRAVSKPRAPLARLGYPVARALQARFRRDSARAVARAIAR